MNVLWMDLLSKLGGTAIFAAALAWLVKSLLTHWLQKDVDLYKQHLASASDLEIERLKSRLAAAAKESEVRFTTLHAKRAECLADIYAQLHDADITFRLLLRVLALDKVTEERRKARATETYEAMQKLFGLVGQKKLYLPKALARRLEELVLKLQELALQYSILDVVPMSPEDWQAQLKRWGK